MRDWTASEEKKFAEMENLYVGNGNLPLETEANCWNTLGPWLADQLTGWKAESESLRKDQEAMLCPVHLRLDQINKLEPFDNCIACIRAERNELRDWVNQLAHALRVWDNWYMSNEPYGNAPSEIGKAALCKALPTEQDHYRERLQDARAELLDIRRALWEIENHITGGDFARDEGRAWFNEWKQRHKDTLAKSHGL